MTVTEVKQSLGSWSLRLRPNTPQSLLDALTPLGHIAIVPGRVNPEEYGDNLLAEARYVGVYRGKSSRDDHEIRGCGMAFWLGDEDDKGDVFEEAVVLNAATFAESITALLPPSGSVVAGTIHSVPGTYTNTHRWWTPRKALSYVTETFGAEWRVNGNGTLDAGLVEDLYNTVPRAILVRREDETNDLSYVAFPGQMQLDIDVEDFTTRVVLLAEGEGDAIATGSADIPVVPYKDIHGNEAVITRLVSESDTPAGSANSRAQLALNHFTSPRTSVTLSTSAYDVKGDVVVGDYLYVFDPEAGFVEPTNEVYWDGVPINPMALRCVEMTWPVRAGWTVAFRDKDGVWYDLSDYVYPESGDTSIVVGQLSRSLTGLGSEVVGTRPNQSGGGGGDSAIPAAPEFTSFTTGVYQGDGQGLTRAVIQAEWTTPLNLDGSTILDGDHYELRYRVNAIIGYSLGWDVLSGYSLVLLEQFNQVLANAWPAGWTNLGSPSSAFSTDGEVGIHAPPASTILISDYTSIELDDLRMVAKLSMSTVPTGDSVTTALMIRRDPNTNTYMRAQLHWLTDGWVWVQLSRVVNGTSTLLGSYQLMKYQGGEEVWLAVQAIGQDIKVMAWPDGGTPPSSWQVEHTETTLTGIGTVGVRTHVGGVEGNGPPTLVGAHLNEDALGTSGTPGWNAAYAEWLAITGIPLAVTRHFCGTTYTITTTISQMVSSGVRICLDFTPPYDPVSESDRDAIGEMLSDLKALGADVRVSLWHEPFFGGLSASQFNDVIDFYGPTVREHYPLWLVFSGDDTDEGNGYYPGDGKVDGIAADCYGTSTSDIDNCQAMADAHNLPLGLWEFNTAFDVGISPSPVTSKTHAEQETFLEYLKDLFADRLASGKPNGDIIMFSSSGGGGTGTQNFLGTARSQTGGFEGGIGTWVAGGNTTVAHSTDFSKSGTGSLKLTATASGTISAAHCTDGNVVSQGMPVVEGQKIAFSVWARPGSTTRNVQPGVLWFTAAGSFISSAFVPSAPEDAGQWKFFSGTLTAPANAGRVKFNPQINGCAASEVHYFDDPQITVLPSTIDHTAPIQYAWDYRIPFVAAMRSELNGTGDTEDPSLPVATYDDITVVELDPAGGFSWDDLGTWDSLISSPVQVDPQWDSISIGWGINTFTIVELTPGVTYELQIRAVDTASPPHQGPWSASSFVTTQGDVIAPSAPAPPEVASSRIAIQVIHRLGRASGGEFNLEYDLHHLDVHVGGSESFFCDTTNKVGELVANAGMLQARIPAVGTCQVEQTDGVWVKVVAVDEAGNRSSASEAVQATVDLIDDAHISDLTVSKITAGTISATWLLAGTIKTADVGERVEMTSEGLKFYNGEGAPTIEQRGATGRIDFYEEIPGSGGFRFSNPIVRVGSKIGPDDDLYGLEIRDLFGVTKAIMGKLKPDGGSGSDNYGIALVNDAGELTKLEDFVFGPQVATILTRQSTTSSSFTDLATVGPSVTVTIGETGRCMVVIGAYCEAPATMAFGGIDTVEAAIGFAMSGANSEAANHRDAYQVTFRYSNDAGGFMPDIQGAGSRVIFRTGLNPGSTTFTMKYHSVNGYAAFFSNRQIAVFPY